MSNELEFNIENVEMGNLNVEQAAFQESIIDVINVCSAALSTATSDSQKTQIK